MNAGNLETKIRAFLNEATASFYTQAEIWRWIDEAAREISQKTLCVRRILNGSVSSSVDNIPISAYKILHVQYGEKFLTKKDPLKVGRYPLEGVTPQYWHETSTGVAIIPEPTATYALNIYAADIAKLKAASAWADWTAGARWTLGSDYTHTGASSDLTLTAGITSGVNYTFEFGATIGTSSSMYVTAGGVQGYTISSTGIYCQSNTSGSTVLKITAVGDVVVDNFIIYKEAAISATGDELELGEEWTILLALYATYSGLMKDKAYGPAGLLASIYSNELDYLRQNVVEVIPDGRDDLEYT